MANSETIRVLFLGDISGKPGREVLRDNLAAIKKKHKIDVCMTNIENVAHGRGATMRTYDEISAYGVDAFTSGNHIFRLKDIYEYLEDESKRMIRPANYPEDVIGRGHMVLDLGKKGNLLVISMIGKAFFNINTTSEPFRKFDKILEEYKDEDLAGIFVDFHAEASSEKVMAGYYLDGKVSAVVGTHTHVPTADERILPGGTAHISDVGMVGPQNSSLWVQKDIMVDFMKHPYPVMFDIEEKGPRKLDGVIVEIASRTKANSIERLNLVFN